MSRFFKAKSIAIIGAGPSGLAAARYLLAEKAFGKIVIFEQGNHVGGLWKYTPEDDNDGTFSVPSTDPNVKLQRPLWRPSAGVNGTSGSSSENSSIHEGSVSPTSDGRGKEPVFLSPIYDRLETNIPRSLMRFSDHAFRDDTQLFPKHGTVQNYLETYADPVRHLIRFETQVTNVELNEGTDTDNGDSWTMRTQDVASGSEQNEDFDAVIVASGHFITPYVPDIPGIREWHDARPGSITHSKWYRIPDPFANQKVIVVGNFASGLDISGQIATVSATPLLLSQKGESKMGGGASNSTIETVPVITELIPSTRSVRFSNGRIEHDVDSIVFCTGYLYTAPFLTNPSITPPLVHREGTRMQNIYQHLFYTPHPTLAMMTLPQKIIPFPVAEAQASVLARVYAGRLPLPPPSEMQ
ncbi:hypothetical protein LTS18_013273, partial [Coniosporium uncinatum]